MAVSVVKATNGIESPIGSLFHCRVHYHLRLIPDVGSYQHSCTVWTVPARAIPALCPPRSLCCFAEVASIAFATNRRRCFATAACHAGARRT